LNSDDKEVDRARGIGISSSESEPDSETDDEAENEAEEEEDIYDKDNPRRSGKITSNLVEPNKFFVMIKITIQSYVMKFLPQ